MIKTILLGLGLFVVAAAAPAAHAQRVQLDVLKDYAEIQPGDLTIPAGPSTSGSAMASRGNRDVYGNVDGAATAVLGDVIVHESGRVRGGAVALGGHVRNEGGSILGVIKDVGATHNRSTVSFGGRPRTTIGSLVAAFLWLAVLLLVGTFVLFFLREYFTRAVEVVTNETGRSLLTGVLGGIASIPALIAIVVALAITIIGAFLIPVGRSEERRVGK